MKVSVSRDAQRSAGARAPLRVAANPGDRTTMRYVYFTKSLQSLDLPGVIAFLKEAGLDGADLAVRPGYPVNPENALTELPRAAQMFRDAGLTIGLVTTPTSLNDPDSNAARALFEACGKAGVPAV